MLTPQIVSEITEKKIELSKDQMVKIYNNIQYIPKYNLKTLSEKLYDFVIENADKKLKGHTLGRTIFHLYELNRLDTYVGIEKLFYAAMIISPEEAFNILSIDDETRKIADKLRYLIETVE
ncbi:MAG: hypothetical protein GF364_05280 [Candidatus Lokiarchaeota archaeon]|nr:hypothetical protein [Candidatus Lokiarchaeota archaeon]